jgi:predicted PurR-regulated permease PerM
VAATTLRLSTASIVRAVVITGAALVVLTVAARASTALVWFVEAAVLAGLAFPVVARLARHMPRFVAVLVLTAAVAVVSAGIAAVALGELRDETAQLRADVGPAMRELERLDGIGPVVVDLNLAEQVERVADDVARRFEIRGEDIPGLATEVGGRASVTFVVWILTVMLVFTGPSFVHGALSLLREDRREPARWVLHRAYRRSTSYLGWMLARSLAVGVLALLAASALGVDMPGVLAAVAALLAFVPYVGIIAGTLPVAVLAATGGPGRSLLVLAAGIALAAVDGWAVQRRVEARTVAVGMFPTLVAALVGFSLRGPGGLLVAVVVVTLLMAVLADTGELRAQDGRLNGHGEDGGRKASASAAVS